MKITADMRKITPSGYAEEAYQASRTVKRYPDVTGPAGVPIPDPRTPWRASTDPKLLARICRAAFAAFKADILSPARKAAMAEALAEALAAAYPPSDMAVLRRYDLAGVRGRTSVEMGRYGYQAIELRDPMLLPNGKGGFHTGAGSGLPLPEAALPYFDDLAMVEDTSPEFMNAQHWPGQFKVREGRWPLWRQIEAGCPRISAWMAKERTGA